MALPFKLHHLIEPIFSLALAGLENGLVEVGFEDVLFVLGTQSLIPKLQVDSELRVGHCQPLHLNAECFRLLDNILGIIFSELLDRDCIGYALS